MARRPDRSPQTVAVLDALAPAAADPGRADRAAGWRYGYELARHTGLASGTLYPILARLADRGYLERRWETDPPPGRPARHLYRLTALGLQLLAERRAELSAASSRVVRSPGRAPGPVVGLG